MRKRQGSTLLELLVATSIFASIATVTGLMYGNALRTMNHSSTRMDARQRMRFAVERVTPMLASTFVPTLASATGPMERPLPPYPANNPAVGNATYDPLSSSGPGNDSVLFYSPSDFFNQAVPLPPVAGLNNHLYELRLDATQQVDVTRRGRAIRNLQLREMIPPAAPGGPVLPMAGRPPRLLATGLSDFRLKSLGSSGLQIHCEAQDVESKSNQGFHNLFTASLDTRAFFPVIAY